MPGSHHKGHGSADPFGPVIAAESSVESQYVSLACLGHASVATYLMQWLALATIECHHVILSGVIVAIKIKVKGAPVGSDFFFSF